MRRGAVAGILVLIVAAAAIAVFMLAREDDSTPGSTASTSTTGPADGAPPPDEAGEALADAGPGDAEAVRAYLDTPEGQPLEAIPDGPPSATCETDLAALSSDPVFRAATGVPDRWLNEAAVAMVAAAGAAQTECSAGALSPESTDALDRAVELYLARLEQIGVDR